MQTRQLGNSSLEITPLGVGAWAIGGGGWQGSMGPQNEADSIPAIHAALNRGINWIDTAALYGWVIPRRWLRKLSGDGRHAPTSSRNASVCGIRGAESEHPLKAESIRRECESSLRRLLTDVIDLYQIHWPEPDEDIEEGWSTLARLQEEGKVRFIGVSNFNVQQMKRAQAIAPINSLQPPYSMVTRESEAEILPFALAHNLGVIVYSPMSAGLLTGAMTRERVANFATEDWRRNLPNFQEPLLSRNLQLVECLRGIGGRHGRTPGEVAIAWTLNHPAVTGAIVGVRSPKQVSGIIGALEFRLSPAEMTEIATTLDRAGAVRSAVNSQRPTIS